MPRTVPAAPEQQLQAGLRQLAQDNPGYGYRRWRALLTRQGHVVNHKRVRRLCWEEGLRLRVSRRKRARWWTCTALVFGLQAALLHHRGALDYVFDQTADARVLKVLTITDEFTKSGLAIEVDRSITGDELVRILDRLNTMHGHPVIIRMDNGPEMTRSAIGYCSRFASTGSAFIGLGAPWRNAFVESFNGKLRAPTYGTNIQDGLNETARPFLYVMQGTR